MSNFKVGDVVEFLENCGSFVVGDRGKVLFVATDSTVKVQSLNFTSKQCLVFTRRVKLVPKDPVLTPEEVFKHLRKGTKLQRSHKGITPNWVDVSNEAVFVRQIDAFRWRIKPEPEVIELNGKRYKLIED